MILLRLLVLIMKKKLLATKTALTAFENKIPDISNLATKSSLSSLLPVSTFNSKATELEGKVTTTDNKFSVFVKKLIIVLKLLRLKMITLLMLL